MLGVLLCLDKDTEDQSRLSFAQICIEMRASSSFLSSVNVQVCDVLFTVVVESA